MGVCTRCREEYTLAVYGRSPLFDDVLMGDRLDLSEPLADAELVGYLMRARIFGAHQVVMSLHAPELRRACAALGVWHRGGRKAELREHLNGAVGHSFDRPMPAEEPVLSEPRG